MARYSGNLLRLAAPENPKVAPGEPDRSHYAPSGPDEVPGYRAEQISVPADTGIEYAGARLEDGVPQAIVAGQPGLGWNPAEAASEPVGSGHTPVGQAPRWLQGDPHNAAVDTSHAHNKGATPLPANHEGRDWPVRTYANPVAGVEGSQFLFREVGGPQNTWASPTGDAIDKFIAGTNNYPQNNPEGDQFAPGRWGGRVYYGFEPSYFVNQPLYTDNPPQTYQYRTAPLTATDPLVGGRYVGRSAEPAMGQLATNPYLTELGESITPSGYGVAVDGVI